MVCIKFNLPSDCSTETFDNYVIWYKMHNHKMFGFIFSLWKFNKSGRNNWVISVIKCCLIQIIFQFAKKIQIQTWIFSNMFWNDFKHRCTVHANDNIMYTDILLYPLFSTSVPQCQLGVGMVLWCWLGEGLKTTAGWWAASPGTAVCCAAAGAVWNMVILRHGTNVWQGL